MIPVLSSESMTASSNTRIFLEDGCSGRKLDAQIQGTTLAADLIIGR
jgi:hypothetical protein